MFLAILLFLELSPRDRVNNPIAPSNFAPAPAVDAEKILSKVEFANRRGHTVKHPQPTRPIETPRVIFVIYYLS